MSTQSLQGMYTAALFKVANQKLPRDAKRHMPIFQRSATSTSTQALKDAANALRTLWKKESIKR
jgi:hypothetical protein